MFTLCLYLLTTGATHGGHSDDVCVCSANQPSVSLAW